MGKRLTDKQMRHASKRRRERADFDTIASEMKSGHSGEELRLLLEARTIQESHRRAASRTAQASERRSISIKMDAAAERAQVESPDIVPSITSRLCGDPPPWRSALATRREAPAAFRRDPLDGLVSPSAFRS